MDTVNTNRDEDNLRFSSGLAAGQAFAASFHSDLQVALDELYKDPHYWSTRPCPTCAEITKVLGFAFGCDKMAKREPLIKQ